MRPERHLHICLLPLMLITAACGGARQATVKEPAAEGDARAMAMGQDKRAQAMRQFMEATQARLAGQPDKAIPLYLQCLRTDPNNAAAHFELAKIYHQKQNPTEALEHAKQAALKGKDVIWYRFLLADMHQQNLQYNEAIAVYRGIINKWPERHEVYFDLANTLAYTGQVGEAVKVYAEMEKRFGLSEEIIMRQFGMLAAAGRLDEAEKLVKRAAEAHPKEASYQGLLGELYDRRGEHDKALAQYLKALDLDPGNSMMRIGLAEHYYATGKHQEAFDQLEQAFLDPEMDIDAKMQVLIGFFEMSNFEGQDPADRPTLIRRSYALIEALELAHPESGKPHTIHGDFLLRDGKLEEAREQFIIALRHERDRFPIWMQVMQLDLQLGDHASLHQHASEAAELFPLLPEAHLFNGIALSRLGRHEEAIEALIAGRDLVVDNRPLEAQFWSSLGDAYNESRQFAKSDAAFDKALALVPDDPTTLNNHAYYLSVRNEQLEKAARMSGRSNDLAPGQTSFQDTYAWVLFRQGKFDEARTWIEKAMASGGDDEGVIVEHYGDILYQLGDTKGAMEQWRRAAELGGASDALGRKIKEGRWLE
ncbi:MAG: tetratricopeptide repeat protein [Flavobacteriales bacterium]|nr:tetratricopeptide repeat protein [Flavobacteriales bacterium]